MSKKMYDKLNELGQGHLVLHLNSLKREDRDTLLNNLESLDLDRVCSAWDISGNSRALCEKESPDYSPIPSISTSDDACIDYKKVGIDIIASDKTAICIMSGGMGSRLGYSGPKGTFMLIPEKSVFQIHVENLLKIADLRGVRPWILIMTSRLNHQDIASFFEKNDYFSYPEERVLFFRQGEIPAFDEDGRILLASKTEVMTAPDGNGGIFKALSDSKIIDKLLAEDVEWLHGVGVDNVLTRPLDPVFIGYAESQNSDLASKSVKRFDSNEKVGVIILKNGKPSILEYTELPEEVVNLRDSEDDFVYEDANIASHLFRLKPLAEKLKTELPFHRAHKKMSCYKDGAIMTPSAPNAYKLEQFLFDIFPQYEKMAVLQVDREREFSPLKNRTGKDSVDSARESYLKFGR